jgi:hypothetical protein
LINRCLNNKENIKIINVKFETDKDDERFNAVVSKVNHHNLILRLKEYKNSYPDLDKAFVDRSVKRMVYFEIFNAERKGKSITVEVAFDFSSGSHGSYEYVIEFDDSKYRIVNRKLLIIT